MAALDSPVNRGYDASLTEQVRRHLEAAISAGGLPPGARIPSERVLCEQFGVSRITVRAALRQLGLSGCVYTRRGSGTFVAEKKLEQPLRGLTSFTEDVRSRGQRPSSRLLEAVVVPAALELANVFNVDVGSPLVRISRVRLVDDLPVAIETSYILRRLCPELETHDFERGSLYATLREVYSLFPATARQAIEAAMPTAEERRLLDLPLHTPVLRMSRVTRVSDGTVFEFARATYRGDRYLLTVDLPGTHLPGG